MQGQGKAPLRTMNSSPLPVGSTDAQQTELADHWGERAPQCCIARPDPLSAFFLVEDVIKNDSTPWQGNYLCNSLMNSNLHGIVLVNLPKMGPNTPLNNIYKQASSPSATATHASFVVIAGLQRSLGARVRSW